MDVNEIVIEGRLSGQPERRTLPSGDEVLALRVVVRRPDGGVDTLPVSVGPAPSPGGRVGAGQVGRRVLAAVERFPADGRVRVEGTLRRRWWRADGAQRSRVEVMAASVVPVDT